MNELYTFRPPRRLGSLTHLVAGIALAIGGFLGIWQATRTAIGPLFLLVLIPSVIALSLVPWLLYLFGGLQRAFYSFERDGIRLRWGLRVEDIPMSQVLWVCRAVELGKKLPLPRLRLPGVLVGRRWHPELGKIEYLAASGRDLVLIATSQRVYAISPEDPAACLQAFQELAELGSLSPIPARSLYPVGLFTQVWRLSVVRLLVLGGLAVSVLLLVWVSLVVPTRGELSLGYHATGDPLEPLPAGRLMLLPLLNGLFFVTDFLLGLFVFRRERLRPLAFLLWGAGFIIPWLFALAIWILLRG
jgi:hypothetical protein